MGYAIDIHDFEFEDIKYLLDTTNEKHFLEHMIAEEKEHISVLLDESVKALEPKDEKIYLDLTFGAGGHTRKILSSSTNCKVLAFDRDPYTQKFADEISEKFGDRFHYVNSEFSKFNYKLDDFGIDKVDGILMDLGFSSMQVDTPRRGFSFTHDGPLDMRMSDEGITAEELVNEIDETELAGIIFKYGDERKSRQIAKAICTCRKNERITRTGELAEIIRKAAGHYNDKINPATRTFQAIRIYLNQELEELKTALNNSLKYLNQDGVISVITFHSGEDKIVKDFFKHHSGYEQGISRYSALSLNKNEKEKNLKIVNKKPITASDKELKENERSRSAKLRIAKKI